MKCVSIIRTKDLFMLDCVIVYAQVWSDIFRCNMLYPAMDWASICSLFTAVIYEFLQMK